MAFPATPLPIKHELYINGAWIDITTDVRGANGYGGTVITRGFSGEQSQLSAGSAQFTINNRGGKYTNLNPTSTYYRQIGRNTPYRNGVDMGVVSARFLDMAAAGTATYDGSVVWAPDSAGVDIVGDIDISVDIDPIDWIGRKGHIFFSKYLIAGNQRSWVFLSLPGGKLQFIWSPDGTVGSRIFATCPVAVTPTSRSQYRVQLDVDNGAGGWTCTFLRGDGTGINGVYTSLGSTSGTGVTSIFSSSARLEVGDANNGASWNATFTSGTDADPFVGRFYGAQLRSSIGGAIVAAMRADNHTAGTTSWSDGANTWTVAGSTFLSATDYRFYGEVTSLPNRWDISGTDIYIPVSAADVIRRLTSGNNAKPLKSPVFRHLSQFAWDGYWPMEQETGSQIINSYIGRGDGFKFKADFESSPTTFPGTSGDLSFSDDTGYAYGNANTISGTPATETYLCYFKFDTIPVSVSPLPFIFFYPLGGTATRIAMCITTTSYQLIILDGSGASLVTSVPGTFGAGMTAGEWNAMRVKLTASGGTVTWEWAWYDVGSATPIGLSGTYAGTIGRPSAWRSDPFVGKLGLHLSHIAMGSFDFDFTAAAFKNATNAYNGEQWDDRARRLAGEENQQVYIEGIQSINGDSGFIKTMGPQPLKTFVGLIQECAVVAGGVMYSPRDKSGVTIRFLEQLVNQPGPSFDYAAGHLSGVLEPEPDDFLIENDVTLTMSDGSSNRFVKTSGSLNTLSPGTDPDAVGTYDVQDSINLGNPGDLSQATQRRVAHGTWDEARYPGVQINLERAPFVADATLTAYARRTDLGRPFTITNPPAWLPPGSIAMMVNGYIETLGGATDQLVFNAVPGGPFTSGVWASTTALSTSLWGARRTTLNAGVNTTATSLVFTTTDKQEIWSTTATGYHVMIAGELMTVSAMGARSGTGPYLQTATVIRSVNGVVKSILATEQVTVVEQGRWA